MKIVSYIKYSVNYIGKPNATLGTEDTLNFENKQLYFRDKLDATIMLDN